MVETRPYIGTMPALCAHIHPHNIVVLSVASLDQRHHIETHHVPFAVAAMTTPSADDVTRQMANETGRGQESYLARRSVLAWQKAGSIPANSDITHLVKLYMSLKKLLGARGGRLTAECFASYNRTITHSRTLKRKL